MDFSRKAYFTRPATLSIRITYRSWHKKFKQWRWLRLVLQITADPDGGPKYANGIIIDITEYKCTEYQLRANQKRLRTLNYELVKAEEGERRRISKCLHDSLGQKLIAVKWEIEHLVGNRPGHSEVSSQGLSLLESCIAEICSPTNELYPRELYGFGLPIALRRLAGDYTRRFI